MMFTLCQIVLLFIVGSAFATTQVVIENGPIVGETITADSRQLTRFLGIPYAQPPVGKLRFRKPVPTSKWNDPLPALNWPQSCVQFTKHPFSEVTEHLFLNNTFTEDCLYLNVWSPNVDVTDEDKLRPVLVWIHGGGLFVGSSSFDIYNGETLAARADAVVVSFNYRLSTLGFLYSDEVSDVPGNQGLWDQALALEWINQNIRYFGGNPNQVTIMGESAGSWSVSLQILSPVARPFYQNAIMLSGAAINDKVVVKPEEYVKIVLTGIRKVGCATEQDTSISAKVMQCLEQLDAATVDQINYIVDKDPTALTPLVVIDGEFLSAKPLDLFAQRNYKTDVKLLVSTVEDEGSFLFALSVPQFQGANPIPLPLDQAKAFLIDFVQNHYLLQPVPEELITKFYFSGLNAKLNTEDEFRKRTGVAFGDVLLGCPTLEFAKNVHKYSPESASVYQWHYKAKLGNEKMLCKKWAGTCHCDDLYPVFGIPFRQPEQYLNRERDISNEVINFISAFLRTGKPDSSHSEWNPYFLSDDRVIAPYYEINNDYRKPENYKFNLKQLECEQIWNKYN